MTDFKTDWIDPLKLYFAKDIPINDKIILRQPTIGQIVDFGEEEYLSAAKTLALIPSDLKPELYDIGIDYEEISDFDLFCMLASSLTPNETRLILGDLDLSKFKPEINQQNGDTVLYNQETGAVIDQRIHGKIAAYVCKLHGFKPKVEHAANNFTKKILIEDDRQRKAMAKNKPYEPVLLPIISALINSAGFKYNSKQIRDVGLYEVLDSVKRLSVIQQSDALMKGMYSGFVDGSKINKDDLDWMRSI